MQITKKIILVSALALAIAVPAIAETMVSSIKINKLHAVGEGLLMTLLAQCYCLYPTFRIGFEVGAYLGSNEL